MIDEKRIYGAISQGLYFSLGALNHRISTERVEFIQESTCNLLG